MIELTGTFDIECANWDRFEVAATYDGVRAKIHTSRESLVDYLLSRGGTWWAHYGGQYDGLAVAEELKRRTRACQIDYPRSRMTRLVCGNLTVRDSYGILPFGLETIAAMSGERCPRLPWDCACALRCGGFCRIGIEPTEQLHDYVVADCRVLYRGMCELIDFCNTNGIELRGTIGGTAWATAKARLGLKDADIPPSVWKQIAPADKGGRTVLVRPVAPGPGTHRDITSAYPAALARTALPVGTPRELGRKNAATALSRSQAGIYRVVVDVPETFLPPLPWRQNNRIRYPFGAFRGVWPLPELEAAIARGVKVLRVDSALCWHRTQVVFASLVKRWYEIRAKVGKDGPWGRWMREVANALTGKFGEQPERRTLRMCPTFDRIVICRREGACRRGCVGACGAWECLDKWGHIWGQPYYRTAPSGHLAWSAYLKAATRIAWLTEAERHGEAHLVAGNTDSIWTTSRQRSIPEGRALGAWETKNTWTEWEARAYNCYRYRDGATGQIVVRASGAPHLTDDEWKRGHLDRERGIETLLEAARAGHDLFHRKNQHWTLPGTPDVEWFGDRKLGPSGTVTYPVDADVLRERTERALQRRVDKARALA